MLELTEDQCHLARAFTKVVPDPTLTDILSMNYFVPVSQILANRVWVSQILTATIPLRGAKPTEFSPMPCREMKARRQINPIWRSS